MQKHTHYYPRPASYSRLVHDRMIYMDNLPTATSVPQSPPVSPANPVGSMAKESSPIVVSNEAPLVTEIGKEDVLSSEVKKAGVRMQSDTIVLPQVAHSMGVKIVDPAPAAAAPLTVSLPLTDDQIAQGLHQSIISSWRWLAEWCERQLKQAHILLKTTQGKIVRTKT